MNLHEYQAKQLFRQYGLPVPEGKVIRDKSEAGSVVRELAGKRWVVKAQVHAGGRGKAGGVELVDDADAATAAAGRMIGRSLVTHQTDERGQPIHRVLIEETSEIASELYLGAVVDRGSQRVVFMASTEGGVEIEEVAQQTPEKIHRVVVHPMLGVMPYQARQLAFALGLSADQIKEFSKVLTGLGRLFGDKDLSLIEINPLVITGSGHLICLDAKVGADDNALYRHSDVGELRDQSQEDERENRAKEWDLNYIALDGNIGCMVNGAGLAMATMDLVKLHGGEPANFLDVGGGATAERVAEAFKIIVSDTNVRAILVNIFGGIVRCDLIAEGIVNAVEEVGLELPVVVRLEGNNATEGARRLNESSFNVIAADSLTDAAKRVITAAEGQ
ncbi:MAG: ADP-forming succinate--CoA ligase subunit beta [Proteobacteria bacterium SW_6_67_9]|nr:MAG: ADP-forming succinate--CoA ligase subunit beta [Proteobacteria bacterium SW_6_67_9]